jgi:hypothetical protein
VGVTEQAGRDASVGATVNAIQPALKEELLELRRKLYARDRVVNKRDVLL